MKRIGQARHVAVAAAMSPDEWGTGPGAADLVAALQVLKDTLGCGP